MSENVGSLDYTITFDTGQLFKAQRDVESRMGRLESSGDRLQAKFTAVATAITAALSAIAIDGVISKITKAQQSFDVMFSSLKTVTGGVDKASAAWERLVEFAKKTPFTLDQSVNGFVKLKALGLDPSERAMTSFGNTASAMGKDLMQMIEAVADASTGEFERLKEFGIKSKTEGDKVTFTFKGVETTVQNSAAAITEYLTRIGETDFAGAMSERMNTLDGDISNLEDSWNGLYLAIAQSGVGDAMRTALQGMGTLIQEATASIKASGLTEYFESLKSVLPLLEVATVSLAGAMTARLVVALIAVAEKAAWATAAAVTMTSATTAFGAAVSMLGGPIGIAITAIALLALNWDKLGLSAANAADIATDSAARIASALKKSVYSARADLEKQLSDYQQNIADLEGARGREKRGSTGKASDDVVREIDDKIDAYKRAAAAAQAALDSLHGGAGRGKINPTPVSPSESKGADPKKLDQWIKQYGTLAEKLALEIKEAKEALGDAFTPDMEKKMRDQFAKRNAKKAPDKFDSEGYLASLRVAAASEIQAANEKETEKLRDAKQKLDARKINETEYQQAVTLITEAAEQDRQAIMARTQQKIDQQREEDARKTKQAAEDKKRLEKEAQDYVFNLTRAVDPLSALEQEYQGKLELVTQYEQLMAAAKVDATEQAEMARAAIENTYATQRQALAEQQFASQSEANAFLMDSVNSLGQTTSSAIMGLIDRTMTAQDVIRSLGQTIMSEAVGALVKMGVQYVKNALLEKTVGASKGAAYASSVAAQVSGMAALAAQNAFAATAAIPMIGPGLAPEAATAAYGAAYALGSPAIMTAPIAGARQYGGPVSSGSLYRVNETGAPEMFVGSNGSQYMMPTRGGSVVAADQVASGTQVSIVVNNYAPGTVASATYDEKSSTVTIAVQEVASQISSNTGPVWSALKGSTNVQGRL